MDNVKVAIRIRPLNDKEKKESDTRQCLTANPSLNSVSLPLPPEPKVFTYDYVADESSTQEHIFTAVGRPVATACLSGFNCTIFAYGQTGAGKTYTILGPDLGSALLEDRGLLPRCAEYLFDSIAREKATGEVEFLVKCSYLEIYQEAIIDLLDMTGESRVLQLREDIKRGVYVEDLAEETLNDVKEAYQRILAGNRNRHIGATSMNKESSRSHTVFTLIIDCKDMRSSTVNFRSSRFHLIDLAGSERQRASDAAGERLKEAGKINKSLSALGNVINSLVDIAEGKNRHVHYRDSKLTFLLKDSLGGNAKTLIIANVSPAAVSFRETLSTLKFVQRAKLIRNKAVINEDTTGNVAGLKAEIKRLKTLLADGANCPRCAGLSAITPASHFEQNQEIENLLNRILHIKLTSESTLKSEIEAKNRKIETLGDIIARHEKRLNHDKLLIKMKDAALARSMQNREDPGEDVLRLEAEARVLREIVQNNPEEFRLRTELQELQSQLSSFQGENGSLSLLQFIEIEEQLSKQLEALLKTLQEERKRKETEGVGGDSDERQMAEIKATYEDRILSLQEARDEERRLARDREEQLLVLLEQTRRQTQGNISIEQDSMSPRPSMQSVFSTLVLDLEGGKIQSLEQQISDLREELEHREVELREYREELEVMSAAGEFIKSQATECAQRAEERQVQNTKLQEEIRELKRTVETQMEMVMKMKNSQGNALEVAWKETETLRKQVGELESGVKDKERENSSLKDSLSDLQKSLESSKSSERLAKEAAAELHRKVSTLAQELHSSKSSFQALQTEVSFYQSENSRLQTTDAALLISSQQQEISALKEQLSTLRQLSKSPETSVLHLSRYETQSKQQSLQQEIEAYRVQLRDAGKKYTELQNTVKELRKNVQELREMPSGSEACSREIERLRKENEQLREEIRVKVEILSNTNRNILATRSEIETWKISIEDKNKTIRALRNELKHLNCNSSDIISLKSALQEKESELSALRENTAKRLKQAEYALDKQRREVEEMNHQSELLQVSLTQCRSQLKAAVLEKETGGRKTGEKGREEVRSLKEGLGKIREFVRGLPGMGAGSEETDVVRGTIRAIAALYERLESKELELSDLYRDLQRTKSKLSLLENERALWRQRPI